MCHFISANVLAEKSERAATNAAGGVCFADQAFEFWPLDVDPSAAALMVQVSPFMVLLACVALLA